MQGPMLSMQNADLGSGSDVQYMYTLQQADRLNLPEKLGAKGLKESPEILRLDFYSGADVYVGLSGAFKSDADFSPLHAGPAPVL